MPIDRPVHDNGDIDESTPPPRPGVIPRDIYAWMLRVDGRTLESFAKLGAIARELAEIKGHVVNVRAEVAEIKNTVVPMREKVASVPDLVEEVVRDRERAKELSALRKERAAREENKKWFAKKVTGRIVDIVITFAITAAGAGVLHYLLAR